MSAVELIFGDVYLHAFGGCVFRRQGRGGVFEFVAQGGFARAPVADKHEFGFVDFFDALFFALGEVLKDGFVALFDDFGRRISIRGKP